MRLRALSRSLRGQGAADLRTDRPGDRHQPELGLGHGRDLQARPDIGQDFLEPFKSQGVAGTDDDALLIRAKFTALPGRQFVLRREIYAAVQQAFAQHGILPTGRGVKVHFEVAGGSPASPSHSAEVRVLDPAARAATG
ncbi:MAG: hypothetical protein ACJ8H8_00410 [Geminicoccaceae bacterium]